jgi:hypothetical protein
MGNFNVYRLCPTRKPNKKEIVDRTIDAIEQAKQQLANDLTYQTRLFTQKAKELMKLKDDPFRCKGPEATALLNQLRTLEKKSASLQADLNSAEQNYLNFCTIRSNMSEYTLIERLHSTVKELKLGNASQIEEETKEMTSKQQLITDTVDAYEAASRTAIETQRATDSHNREKFGNLDSSSSSIPLTLDAFYAKNIKDVLKVVVPRIERESSFSLDHTILLPPEDAENQEHDILEELSSVN